MAKSSKSKSTAAQKAAAARAAAESSQKRRQRIINGSIAAVLGVVVLALIGGAWWQSQQNQANDQANPDAARPTGTLGPDSEYPYGVNVAGEAPGKPVLEIWEDFQCPGCKSFEQTYGKAVEELAASGDARVIWRTTTFLDSRIPGDNSMRAANAFGCAIDADKKVPYHDIVFQNQPTEGRGYTDEDLIAWGEQVGISGAALDTFSACVVDGKYNSWTQNSYEEFQTNNVPGTPALFLNGEELDVGTVGGPEGLVKAVREAKA